MYEVICKYCGTKKVYPNYRGHPTKFCDSKCQAAWSAKNKRDQLAEKRNRQACRKYSQVIMLEEQCAGCYYSGVVGGCVCCNYFEIAGHTRHSLHPDGLPQVCEEYKPKKKNRSNAMTIKQRRK